MKRPEDAEAEDRTEQLARRVGALLMRAGERIASAESLTAGYVQSSIASVSGSSGYFVGGLTAYDIDAKVELLGVDRAEAERSDCVSAEVARQMAHGAQRVFGADVGIGTTGYADGVDVPFAFLAVVAGDTEAVERFDGPGLTRRQMQCRTAARVLELVVESPHHGDAVLALKANGADKESRSWLTRYQAIVHADRGNVDAAQRLGYKQSVIDDQEPADIRSRRHSLRTSPDQRQRRGAAQLLAALVKLTQSLHS